MPSQKGSCATPSSSDAIQLCYPRLCTLNGTLKKPLTIHCLDFSPPRGVYSAGPMYCIVTRLIWSLNGLWGSAAECGLFHPLSNEALSKSYYNQLVVALLFPISGCMKEIITLSSVISSQVLMKRAMCSQCCTSAVTVEASHWICDVSLQGGCVTHTHPPSIPKKKCVWSQCVGLFWLLPVLCT